MIPCWPNAERVALRQIATGLPHDALGGIVVLPTLPVVRRLSEDEPRSEWNLGAVLSGEIFPVNEFRS